MYDKKLIAIQHLDSSQLIITLQLTTSCTYACRYCPEVLHSGVHPKFNLDELKEFFIRFKDRQLILTLTGGEVTTHLQFEEVIQLANSLNIKTLVDTNNVRTVRFYKEVGSLVDVWNITLHPSQHTLDLEKITCLTDNSFVVVYIMMDPDYWDTSIDWWDKCCQLTNIKVIPLKVVNNWAGAVFETTYTAEQQEWLLHTPSKLLLTTEREAELKVSHTWMMHTESNAMFADGSVEQLDGYMIIKQDLNRFYGWQCMAGDENILIYSNGSASWANCSIKTYDHFLEIDPAELKTPITCNRVTCDCVTDIRSTKALA